MSPFTNGIHIRIRRLAPTAAPDPPPHPIARGRHPAVRAASRFTSLVLISAKSMNVYGFGLEWKAVSSREKTSDCACASGVRDLFPLFADAIRKIRKKSKRFQQ